MKLRYSFLLFTTSVHQFIGANAEQFDCTKNDVLQKYRLSTYTKIDQLPVFHHSIDTPPTKSEVSWFLNICSLENNEQNSDRLATCDKDSVICGNSVLLEYEVDKKNKQSPIVSEVINVSKNTSPKSVIASGDQRFYLEYSGLTYGSQSLVLTIDYTCDEKMSVDEIKDVDIGTNAQSNSLKYAFSVQGPGGCLVRADDNKPDDNKPDDNKPDDGNKGSPPKEDVGTEQGHTSWLTYLLMYVVLFTLIYVGASSYMAVSSRSGDLHDFRQEFVERLVVIIRSCPSLLKELFNKIMHRGNDLSMSSSSTRGGYSAV